MAHLNFTHYEGTGEIARFRHAHSQAVRIGDVIEISGQAGSDRATGAVDADLGKEIEQAFLNVEQALKTSGGSGWEQVYKLRSYHVGLNEQHLELMVRCVMKYCPGHQPLWTLVGVEKLALAEMRVLVEATAHAPPAK